MKTKEIRTIDLTGLNTLEEKDIKSKVISGYAAIFETKAHICEWFDEIIAKGAFKKSLSTKVDVRCLFNHDWGNVLGRVKNGTLSLKEDDKGLYFEVVLPNTTTACDLSESVRRGDINQCSFGFIPTVEEWDYKTEPATRTVSEVELFEVSIVAFPAYEDTEAIVRNKDTIDAAEKRLSILHKIKECLL